MGWKAWFVVLALASWSGAALAQDAGCETAAYRADFALMSARRYFPFRDVDPEVRTIRAAIAAGCVTYKSLGVSKKELTEMRNKGLRAEARNRYRGARAASRYRDVDTDVRSAKDHLAKSGIKEKVISESQWREVAAVGRMNAGKDRENCGAVDVSERFGPVRDQDSMGWCFAFAAADLLSFKTGQRVSAADIALALLSDPRHQAEHGKVGKKYSEMSHGNSADAARAALARGLCPEKDFPSESLNNLELVEAIEFTERTAEKRKHTLACFELDELGKPFDELSDIVTDELLAGGPPGAVYERLNRRACEGKRVRPQVEIVQQSQIAPERAIATVDEQLNASNAVVAELDVMELIPSKRSPEKRRGAHAMSVVGRRFNEKTQKCEYRMRNSWGSSCAYYHDRHLDCDGGELWVPRELLHMAIDGVIYAK